MMWTNNAPLKQSTNAGKTQAQPPWGNHRQGEDKEETVILSHLPETCKVIITTLFQVAPNKHHYYH